MKHLFILLAAAGLMAGCSQDEVVETPKGLAINFDGGMIDAATRAGEGVTTNDLTKIWVSGIQVDATDGTTIRIFNKKNVEKGSGAIPTADWTYSPLQYYFPNKNYTFFAVTSNEMTKSDWTTGSFSVNNHDVQCQAANNYAFKLTGDVQAKDGEEDVVVAWGDKQIPATTPMANPGKVAFTFKHILSRVMFTLTDGSAEGMRVKVTGVEGETWKNYIYQAANQAAAPTVKLAAGENPSVFTLPFNVLGNGYAASTAITTDPKYIAPIDATALGATHQDGMTITVSYDVEEQLTDDNGNTSWQKVYQKTIHGTVSHNQFQMGQAYNITATLNASADDRVPIEFTVNSVDAWPNNTGAGITVQ